MRWKEVGYLNAYRISENGDLQSRLVGGGRYKKNSLGKWKPKKACFKRSDYTGAGYLATSIKIDENRFVSQYIHRLVAKAFCLNENGGTQVDHINGDRLCNKATNLRWVKPQENMDNAKERGAMKGKSKYKGKLSKEQVLTIITMINAGKRNCDIAKEYKVDPSNISKVRNKSGDLFKDILHLVSNPRPRKIDQTWRRSKLELF